MLQMAVSAVFLYAMYRSGMDTHLYIPFVNVSFEQHPILYIFFAMFVMVGCVNAVNLTDGVDGLATGVTFVVMIFFTVTAALWKMSDLALFPAALMGGLAAFFVAYNRHPAKCFMGDTGSLTLGGIIAVFAILIRIELLLPILCGIFLVETVSVMLQVSYFKYTKKKYGEGRRLFKMAPIHHHYQKNGLRETKIVIRFWIIGIILAIITLVTLKIR
jgi:phospho-N-acetylmuramoyl-pentapeptide-transferase